MANLKKYADQILSEQDKTLFQEAIVSAAKGAPRGAYILIWISCAESLKRKFKEAALRDGQANRVVGLIQDAEDNHRSADMLILNNAKTYGFIDDATYQKLEHVYDLRCVYGHPYESAPSDIELISAADVVVKEVLSKPTVLKQGFVLRLIEQLFSDTNYLEQSEASVREFAKEIADKIDPAVYPYLLEKYSEKIEPAYGDATLQVVVKRGLWFLSALLEKAGTNFYNATQWHDYAARFPNTSQNILLSRQEIFSGLGVRAKDYIISFLQSESERRPTLLKKLEKLFENGHLSDAQTTRFKSVNLTAANSAHLKITSCFDAVIEAFKSHNWYAQNPAAQFVKTAKRTDLQNLSANQQEILGRNILQAAEGGSGHSGELLTAFQTDQTDLPEPLIKGLIYECFINEDNQFRLKNEHLDSALQFLISRPALVTELSGLITSAQPKAFITEIDFTVTQAAVALREELSELTESLAANRERLTTTPSE